MAVDPYVPTRPEDAPRGSVKIPPARGWRAVRPGDLVGESAGPKGPGQPAGRLLGTPGPDAGYALTLAERFRDRLEIASPETAHDALAVGAELAIRRAASFGRAPVATDLEIAFTLFGWLGGAPSDLVDWRRLAVAGAGENYSRRRELVDLVPDAVFRRRLEEIRDALPNWRKSLFDPDVPPVPGAARGGGPAPV